MHNNVFIFARFLRNVYYQIKVVFCFISNMMLVSNFKRASNFSCKIVILPLTAHKRTNKTESWQISKIFIKVQDLHLMHSCLDHIQIRVHVGTKSQYICPPPTHPTHIGGTETGEHKEEFNLIYLFIYLLERDERETQLSLVHSSDEILPGRHEDLLPKVT